MYSEREAKIHWTTQKIASLERLTVDMNPYSTNCADSMAELRMLRRYLEMLQPEPEPMKALM